MLTEEEFIKVVESKKGLEERLKQNKNVTVIGITVSKDKYAIRVNVSEEKYKSDIPEKHDGVPVIVKVGEPRRRK